MLRLTRENTIRLWKVHKFPTTMKLSRPYYVGPDSGRLVVCDYKTKAEAKAALEMKEWLIKFLMVRP
jgi:hypothetical protein